MNSKSKKDFVEYLRATATSTEAPVAKEDI